MNSFDFYFDTSAFSDFKQFSHYSPIGQNSLGLYQKRLLRKVGQGSFVNRPTRSWNMLPDHVVSRNNNTAFKTALVGTSLYEGHYIEP